MKRLSASELIQKDFIENRSRLIDLAAFLDRIDRASHVSLESDFRMGSLQKAIVELIQGGSDRVERIQNLLSDQSILLLESAEKNQGAFGAVQNGCC